MSCLASSACARPSRALCSSSAIGATSFVMSVSSRMGCGSSGAEATAAPELPQPIRELTDMTKDVAPIALDEHKARLGRAQALLAKHDIDALVVGPSTSLTYFTGAR